MNRLTKIDILQRQITCIKTSNGYENNEWGVGDPVGMILPLKAVLYDLPVIIKDRLIEVQNMVYHSKEQKEAKLLLPRYYISGVFDLNEYNIDRFPIHDIPKHGSGLMTIDIDEKDNENIDIWEIRRKIFELPYVFSCLKSVSGHGYYCIIPIEDTVYTKDYYMYIMGLWKKKFNINIDKNAASLIRARILSYNEDIEDWIKEDVDVWRLRYIGREEEKKCVDGSLYDYNLSNYKNVEDGLDWNYITNKAMELLINDGYHATNYNSWFYLGCELKNFDNGEELFYKASNNVDYNDSSDTIRKKWNSCKASGIDDDLIRKWVGMANNKYGKNWFVKYIKK